MTKVYPEFLSDMRPTPGWMSLNDLLILEFLQEHDLSLPPRPLYYNLNRRSHDIGYSTVRKRVKILESHNLLEIEDEDRGYYAVSDKGQAYLNGELDVDDLEENK